MSRRHPAMFALALCVLSDVGNVVLLLTGSLVGGGFADEPLAHQLPAGIQFGLSVIALVALARIDARSGRASRAAAQ